jgi:predicted regulator of Ras-like GTPase activity (Roadblock/LC7/MglB family)
VAWTAASGTARATAWAAAVAADPSHAGARRGLGFLHYRAGRLVQAEAELRAAAPADREAARGLERVRRELDGAGRAPAPPTAASDARALFVPLLGEDGDAALLLDADGLVIAGAFRDAAGRDVAEAIGAQLTGVSDDATRAMRHLDLGAWTTLSLETERAVVTLAPAPHDSVLLVAARADAPLGSVRRLVERVGAAAARWLAPA